MGSQIILWEVPPLQFYYVVILSYADDVCAYVIPPAILHQRASYSSINLQKPNRSLCAAVLGSAV